MVLNTNSNRKQRVGRIDLLIGRRARTKLTMKSPIRWRRRKKLGGKEGKGMDKQSNLQKKKSLASDWSDEPIEADQDTIVNADSCDATDLFSYESTIGDRSKLEPPGWVHNAKNNGHIMKQLRIMTPTQMAEGSAAIEWPQETRSIASRSHSSRSHVSKSLGSTGSHSQDRRFGTVASNSSSVAYQSDASRLTQRSLVPQPFASRENIQERRQGMLPNSSSSAHHNMCDMSQASRESIKREVSWRPTLTAEIESTSSESTVDDEIFASLSKCSSSDSMPPPGFRLPRKEVRDAIKYHHKLGKALSELAINPEFKCIDDGNGKNDGVYSLASTNSTEISTVDSSCLNGLTFVNSDCGLGAINAGASYKRNDGGNVAFQPMMNLSSKQWVAKFDDLDYDNGLEQVSSLETPSSSGGCSNKSSRSTKLEQHLSFLERHMIQKVSSYDATPDKENCNDCITPITSHLATLTSDRPENGTFFPVIDDLRSPPMSNSSSKQTPTYKNLVSVRPGATQKSATMTPLSMASPPSTPVATLKSNRCEGAGSFVNSPELEWSDDDTMDNVLNGKELVEDLRRIKNETASMMIEMKDKIRSDIKATMDKEMEEHRSRLKMTVTEMSKRLENAVQAKADNAVHRSEKENHHPQFSPSRRMPSPYLQKQHRAPSPLHQGATTTTENSTDSKALLKELEKSLQSMEASIMSKIITQMDKDAIQQRQAIEEMIDEKVSKVIEGSSLEIKLAVQEVQKETERMSKIALRERTPPPPERAMSRMRSVRGNGLASPCRPRMPSPGTSSGKKSDKCDNFWIQRSSSSVKETDKGTIEDSFAETMRVIDEFVDDCDDIVNDFDKIAFRMQDADVSDPECDPEDEFEYIGIAN